MINKRVYELVRVFEIEPISLIDDREEPILLRVEILKAKSGIYKVKVLRSETFRIIPTYPFDKKSRPLTEPCDKTFFIDENSYDWNELEAKSEDTMIKKVFGILSDIFCVEFT